MRRTKSAQASRIECTFIIVVLVVRGVGSTHIFKCIIIYENGEMQCECETNSHAP